MKSTILSSIAIFGAIALFVIWGLDNAYPQ